MLRSLAKRPSRHILLAVALLAAFFTALTVTSPARSATPVSSRHALHLVQKAIHEVQIGHMDRSTRVRTLAQLRRVRGVALTHTIRGGRARAAAQPNPAQFACPILQSLLTQLSAIPSIGPLVAAIIKQLMASFGCTPPPPPTGADLSLGLSGWLGDSDAGKLIDYTATVTNRGPENANTVTLSDALPSGTTFSSLRPLPQGWSCVTPTVGATGAISCTASSLAAGASAAIEFIVRVSPGTNGSVTNGAIVSSTTSDPNTNNNSASITTNVS
jgi:uncharacterized repeat protein (TIGR01451 family)